jgi:hypothetical protein
LPCLYTHHLPLPLTMIPNTDRTTFMFAPLSFEVYIDGCRGYHLGILHVYISQLNQINSLYHLLFLYYTTLLSFSNRLWRILLYDFHTYMHYILIKSILCHSLFLSNLLVLHSDRPTIKFILNSCFFCLYMCVWIIYIHIYTYRDILYFLNS